MNAAGAVVGDSTTSEWLDSAASALETSSTAMHNLRLRADGAFDRAEHHLHEQESALRTLGEHYSHSISNAATAVQHRHTQIQAKLAEATSAYAATTRALEALKARAEAATKHLSDEIESLKTATTQAIHHTQEHLHPVVTEGAMFANSLDHSTAETQKYLADCATRSRQLREQALTQAAHLELQLQILRKHSDTNHHALRQGVQSTHQNTHSNIASATDVATTAFGHGAVRAAGELMRIGSDAFQLSSAYDRQFQKINGQISQVVALVRAMEPVFRLIRQLS